MAEMKINPKHWLNSLSVIMSNVKVVATETNITHYIDLYDAHMDQIY